jgi:hypothetical protein
VSGAEVAVEGDGGLLADRAGAFIAAFAEHERALS